MTFWLDTNVLYDHEFLRSAAPLCAAQGIDLLISPLVHAERLAQVRRKDQRVSTHAQLLATYGIRVGGEEETHGEFAANILFELYPTQPDWARAALDMYARRLGVEAPSLVGKCTGALDPYVAALAVGRGDYFVSHDGKEERLPHHRVLSTAAAIELLKQQGSR